MNPLINALIKIANNEHSDLTGDVSKWASTIAYEALGGRIIDGKKLDDISELVKKLARFDLPETPDDDKDFTPDIARNIIDNYKRAIGALDTNIQLLKANNTLAATAIQEHLIKAGVASCQCMTKSPDPVFHSHDCRYKHIQEASQLAESIVVMNGDKGTEH